MCGRFSIFTPRNVLASRFGAEPAAEWKATYNAAPTQQLPVILNTPPATISLGRWGLIPGWANDPRIGNRLINARAETLLEKPSFREAFVRRRCLVLADGFYEWKRSGAAKIPHRVAFPNNEPFAMAGIWDVWRSPGGDRVTSFSIITTEPNALLKDIHDRMPAILKRDDESTWLQGRDIAQVQSLLAPYPGPDLEAYPVSDLVNSPKNDSQEVIRPRLPLLWGNP